MIFRLVQNFVSQSIRLFVMHTNRRNTAKQFIALCKLSFEYGAMDFRRWLDRSSSFLASPKGFQVLSNLDMRIDVCARIATNKGALIQGPTIKKVVFFSCRSRNAGVRIGNCGSHWDGIDRLQGKDPYRRQFAVSVFSLCPFFFFVLSGFPLSVRQVQTFEDMILRFMSMTRDTLIVCLIQTLMQAHKNARP